MDWNDVIQNIMVYIILAMAVSFLIYKFLIPKSFRTGTKKSISGSCGTEGCDSCH